MFCYKCGKEIDDQSTFCVHCGTKVKTTPPTSTPTQTSTTTEMPTEKKSGNGRGIASMVLGIIGLFYALMAFLNMQSLGQYLVYNNSSYQIGFAIGFVLMQSIFAILAVSLAGSERIHKKTGYNTAGLWLSISTFVCVVIQFLIIITD